MAALHIPPEIWRLIFRQATYYPGLLDTSPVPPLAESPRCWTVNVTSPEDLSNGQTPIFTSRVRRAHMKTKLSLVLVCRLWQCVAYEFLYEYILINSRSKLSCLVATLEGSPRATATPEETSSAARRHLGWSIKSIELDPSYWWAAFPGSMDLCSRLFRLCDDIRIFWGYTTSSMVDADMKTPATVAFHEISQLIKSLRYCSVDWTPVSINPLSSGLLPIKFMHTYGLMEYLRLNLNGYGAYADYPISLPRLHTIDLITPEDDMIISSVMSILAKWNLPALRTVSLSSFTNPKSPALESFFAAHNAVTTLILISYFDTGSCLHSILSHCTGVEDLTLAMGQIYEPLPPITHLRRITMNHINNYGLVNRVLGNLLRAKRPRLCTIRFHIGSMDYQTLRGRLEQEWKEQWAREGVQLEEIVSQR
jgi:hypothetical protein